MIPLYDQLQEPERIQLDEFCNETGNDPQQVIRAGVRFILDNQDDEDVIEGIMKAVSD